jgi:hypothetical protein
MVTTEEVLSTAIELTTGDRRRHYGTPYENHERIARIWQVILGVDVTPSQVALCMVGVKLTRLVETPDHLDSFIDGAAYMALAAEIINEPTRSKNGDSETKPKPTKATEEHRDAAKSSPSYKKTQTKKIREAYTDDKQPKTQSIR